MPRLRISLWLPVALCLFYRFDPWGMFFPFLLATALHELGHILCLHLTGAKVTALSLNLSGAVIETTPLGYGQEALCALAGPAVGLLLLLLGRKAPWLAFWGLTQSLYNLIPVYPLDGGRALRAVLCLILPLQKAEDWSYRVTLLSVLGFCVGSWAFLRQFTRGWLSLFPALLLLFQTLPVFLTKMQFPVAKTGGKRYNKG